MTLRLVFTSRGPMVLSATRELFEMELRVHDRSTVASVIQCFEKLEMEL